MGQRCEPTTVYVGVARLPQPIAAPVSCAAVEIEIGLRSRLVSSVSTNLPFPALQRLLSEVLLGRKVDDLHRRASLELEVRYAAPFSTAVATALQSALRRASDTAGSRASAAENGHGERASPPPANGRRRAENGASASRLRAG